MSLRRLVGASVVMAIGAVALAAWWTARWSARPLALPAGGTTLVVERGEPFGRVAARLEAGGFIGSARVLVWLAQLRGDSSRVQAGEYLLSPGTTPASLLAQLVAGRVAQHTLTLVEGRTFRESLAMIQAHPAVRVTLRGIAPSEVMTQLGRPGIHPEGQFFPDTYAFPRGTTDLDLLRQALGRMERALAAAWAERDPSVPLAGPYQALVLASIVEKETGAPDERPLVAGVFVNRLRLGMRLQTDPSVIYGLGPSFDGNLRRNDLLTDTPYNTYRRRGLPPTPIALVGEAALAAAVRPARTESLYFVATGLGDGRHYFAATLNEHNDNVARYLAATGARRSNGMR